MVLKNYELFASVYQTVETMLRAELRDRALELETVSRLFVIPANSLHEAIDKMVEIPEFDDYAAKHNQLDFYYLDAQKRPHHV